jgi:Ca2+-binding EF-hand superfamily protein
MNLRRCFAAAMALGALTLPAWAQEAPQDQDAPRRERAKILQRNRGLDAEQIFEQLDQNQDSKLSQEEIGERERLLQADADQDGFVTREELQNLLARRRDQAEPQLNAEQLFARLDQNKDEKITKEELNERSQWLLSADANEDGEITLAEAKAGLERMRERSRFRFDPEQTFTRLDENQDGKLQKDELRGPFAAGLTDLDADNDGEITKQEFLARADRIRARLAQAFQIPTVDEMFTQYDANQDGKLVKDELPERTADFVLRADRDNDGAVTKEELQAARERMQRQREDREEGERPQAEAPPQAEATPKADAAASDKEKNDSDDK